MSPVFWISALCKFKKPVTLEIQHCASRDEASFADLNFVSTKCSQKELPYIFRQLDGGRFLADSSYGSIQLSHFSGFGITGRKRTPRAYCAQIYYTMKEEASDWRVNFIITKDLDTLKTVCGWATVSVMPQFHCCMYLLHCRLSAKTIARKQLFRSNLNTMKLVLTFLKMGKRQKKAGE